MPLAHRPRRRGGRDVGDDGVTSLLEAPWWQGGRGLVVAAAVVAILPLLVAIPRVLSTGAFALNGDVALIELRVRDVFGAHTPLVGSYQRYGFNQPGPLYFYLLTGPYRLLGSGFSGLQVASLLGNAGALVGIVVVAYRRGGALLAMWTLTIASVLAHAMGALKLADPWEPHISVLPLTLLVLIVAELTTGRTRLLPVAAALATVLAQAYAVLLPVVLGLTVWGVAVLVAGIWLGRDGRPVGDLWRPHRRPTLLTAGVILVLWFPPLIDQLAGGGNVSKMKEFFRSSPPTIGFGDAFRAIALQFDDRATWLGNDVPYASFTTSIDLGASRPVPFALLVLVGATALAVWRRQAEAALLGATVLAAVGVGIVGLSRLAGEVYPWILVWTQVLGAATWLAAGWCLHRSLPGRWRERSTRILVPLLGVAIVVLGAMNLTGALTQDRRPNPGRDVVVALSDEAVAAARGADGPVLMRSTADVSAVFGAGGFGEEEMVLALDRAGVDVVVAADRENRYGPHRAEPGRAVRELLLVSGERPSGYDMIATIDPLSPSQRAERKRLLGLLEKRSGRKSLADLAEQADRDPVVRRALERLGEIPDMPELTLLARDLE